MQGWVQIRSGNPEEGVRKIQDALSLLCSREARGFRPQFLAYQSEGHGKLGQADIGISVLAEALEFVETNGERLYEAELYRLKGELTLEARGWRLETSPLSTQASSLKPPVSWEVAQEAEEYFLQAIDIAQKQQAKSWELRASTSLARLWQSQGKKAEAHKLLSEVYNWFTEGFDTKDLQEAKALLAELSD